MRNIKNTIYSKYNKYSRKLKKFISGRTKIYFAFNNLKTYNVKINFNK
jgi:hypothetical protein